jgi:hypothetical protein
MKRKSIRTACIVIGLLAGGYVGAILFVGSIVRTGVNRFAPSITQTPVRLDRAGLSPLSGSGTLWGLFVGNPPGWSGDKAFFINKVHVEVVPTSIFSDCIVLNDVSIDGPDFVYETRLFSSNIGDLLKNIQSSSNNQADKAQPVNKQGKPLRFIVKHLTLTNGRVTLGLGATAITIPMPTLIMNDIGTREGGISSADLTLAVMKSFTGGIVTATTNAAGKIGSTMGAAAVNSAKSAEQSLKTLLGGNK